MNLSLLKNINQYVKSVQDNTIDILNHTSLNIDINNINTIKLNPVADSCFLQTNTGYVHKSPILYYKNGIISKMYNVGDVSYDYIFGYIVFKQYCKLFTHNIYFLFSGINNYDIVNGISKYMIESTNKYNIKYKFITDSNNSIDKHDLLKGIVNNDLGNTNNVTYWKSKLYNKGINCIFNAINPSNSKNILLSIMYYALDPMFYKSGILFTRIFDTNELAQEYIDYILLFCIVFKNVNIFKIPNSKNDIISYRYYLVCHKKNKLSSEYNWLNKKLLSIIDFNEKLVLVDSVSLTAKTEIISKLSEMYEDITQDSMVNFINILDMH
jgi:hypothetical protein